MKETIYRCDRCGKTIHFVGKSFKVAFEQKDEWYDLRFRTHGDVCEECANDFTELAKSFFDDLNKEAQE